MWERPLKAEVPWLPEELNMRMKELEGLVIADLKNSGIWSEYHRIYEVFPNNY